MPTAKRMRALRCSGTGEEADPQQLASLSPAGAPWLVDYRLDEGLGRRWRSELGERPWTLWRYHELLPLDDNDARIDLGEGGTPLIGLRHERGEPRLLVKEESGNPTGSFKARGLTMAVNRARELGAPGVELASAGNAAYALATYAAAAGLGARVALPTDTPASIASRCNRMGAKVVTGGRNLVESRALLAADDLGYFDLSTFREPYRVEGKKTMGFEVVEQLGWSYPDWIVYPTGGGTGIAGMAKAFDELETLGLVRGRRPRFLVVQTAGCDPFVQAFEAGADHVSPHPDPVTDAYGLRVPSSLGDALVLSALHASRGAAIAVPEEELAPTAEHVARRYGLLIGPEGAAAFAAVTRAVAAGRIEPVHRVVVFQTGHPGNYGWA